MQQLLQPGRTDVTTETSRTPVKVLKFLGGGGQGEVYAADLNGKPVAVKWYFPASATPAQRTTLQELVAMGPPSSAFLWPIELATAPDLAGFGYLMPLREERFKGVVDLVTRRAEPTFSALARSCFNLATGFFMLHANGLCYRDISFGNVFFDPSNGDVLIADNDNVVVNKTSTGGVLGTPRFMAPEVVRGEAVPNTNTDLFSLAVLLFYMLMLHHPLEGIRESRIHALDLPAMNRLYGTDPLFIFDPDDASNQPDPLYHRNAVAYWPLYPQVVRDLFIRSFTVGLRDAEHGRVMESEWRQAMLQLGDSIVYCRACGAENFYGDDASRPCWSCQQHLHEPIRIEIGRSVVVLNHDSKLYPHHVDPKKQFDVGIPIADVTQHPNDPSKWGIRNLSGVRWVATPASGAMIDVDPGRSLQIAVGTKVNFGASEGWIRM
jgi:DNA-binding helix-hairpin-helix protein with protein kinase domain